MGGMLYGTAQRLVLKAVHSNLGNLRVLLRHPLHNPHKPPPLLGSCSMLVAPKAAPFLLGPAAYVPKSTQNNAVTSATSSSVL
jgi:hypothetical protein